MNEIVFKLLIRYDLKPCKVFSLDEDKKIEITYGFDNGLLVIDALEKDEDFKSLNLSISQFCERVFSSCQIRYDQENQFYID